MRRRFELVEGTSKKFWEVEQSGSSFTVRYGRIGAGGRAQTKELGSAEEAAAEVEALIRDKVRKGYAEVSPDSSTASVPASAPSPRAPGRAAQGKALVTELVKAHTKQPFWLGSGLPEGRACFFFEWGRLEDDIQELVENDTGLEELGGAKAVGVIPFAAVIDVADLSPDDFQSKRSELLASVLEDLADGYLVYDKSGDRLLSNPGGRAEAIEWSPQVREPALGDWVWTPCPRPPPKRDLLAEAMTGAKALQAAGKPEDALAALDAFLGPYEATPWEQLPRALHGRYDWPVVYRLRADLLEQLGRDGVMADLERAAKGSDWDAMARVAAHHLARRDFEKLLELDYSFLCGTRDQHRTVLSAVVLAYFALGEPSKATQALRQLWRYVKPTPEEAAALHREALAMAGDSPETRPALEAVLSPPPDDPAYGYRWAPAIVHGGPTRELVVWSALWQPGLCRLDGVAGLKEDWRLTRGFSFEEGKPLVVTLRMWKRMAWRGLLDDVPNDLSLKVCSARLVEFLRRQNLKNVEFLPVTIVNARGRTESTDHFIVNPILLQDVLDLERSRAKFNAIAKTVINDVESIVIDSGRLDPQVRLFRLARFIRPILIEKSLADELLAQGFEGLSFSPLDAKLED